MITRSKAPLRLGLAGGGTDVSPYSDQYGGYVLNATINLYCHCTLIEKNNNTIEIESYDANYKGVVQSSNKLSIEDGNAILIKGVYNRIVKDYTKVPLSFKIITYNDAPIGSGLGTSSTMVVCILKAFVEWLNLPLGDYDIANLAYEIERKDLKLAGGKQDQYAATFGGFNFIEFYKDDRVIVNPLKVKRWIIDELEASMLLFFSGVSRSSAKIIDEQKKNTIEQNYDAIQAMHALKLSAKEMKSYILRGDIRSVAQLIDNMWQQKKKMATNISNETIDLALQVAKEAGAWSGKVTGAGGGGFIIFFVSPQKKKQVELALQQIDGFVFPFQFSDGGAHGWKIFD